MKQWAQEMHNVAKSVKFEDNGFKVTKEIEDLLLESENGFKKLSKFLDGHVDGKKAAEICKKMVYVYITVQDLLDILIKELNKSSFIAHVHQMHSFFVFLNKVLKLAVKFDLFKIQNPTIFAIYSEYRLIHPSELRNDVEQIEDQKISTFQSISMPLGRLFLSFFSNSKFDLVSPCLLSKITKIAIDQEKLDNLGIYASLAKLNDWKYANMFLAVVINRLANRNVLVLGSQESDKLKKYFELLLKQL